MSDFETREGMEKRHVDPGDVAGSLEDIRAEIDSDFATMLLSVDSVDDLPAGANVRANGIFDDPKACLEWLMGWGVSFDENSNPVQVGFVYAVRVETDEGEVEYHIYVEDTSE